jgi:predicted nucleic acid-binding protein
MIGDDTVKKMNGKKTLYIETTIPSYATAKESRDRITAGRQETTKRFWQNERHKFELYTSVYTSGECSRGDAEAAKKRMSFLDGITELVETDEVILLADIYSDLLKIPPKAKMDCFHLAVCVRNRLDYLFTWNFSHLGTASQNKLKIYNKAYGLWTPVLVTPETIYDFMEVDVNTLHDIEVDYPWDDEIMAEVRQWKAEIIEKYGSSSETLHQHFLDVEAKLRKEGYKFADTNEVYNRNLRRQLTENL